MTKPETVERHASWLELFFDLVVVVAVYQLAHLLHGNAHHGPAALDIVTFFALYLAIWLLWTNYTLYANVVADKVRTRAMFMGMAGIATMAATIPHSMDSRANWFAATYVIASVIGTGAFRDSGKFLMTWMAASRNAGLLPWIVSFWIDGPWWKLGLWLFGLAVSIWTSVFTGRSHRADQDRILARLNARTQRQAAKGRRQDRPTVVAAELDAEHLGERLGLFVIIVLGEALLQLVRAVAAIEDWSPGTGAGWLLLLTAVSAFALLAAIWALNVRHGFAEVTRLQPATTLPAHFAVVASITTVAAGLGVAAAGPTGHMNPSSAWLMCAGASAFLLVINLLVAHTRRWSLRAVAVAVPVVAGVLAPWLPAAVLVTILAAAAVGQLLALSHGRKRA